MNSLPAACSRLGNRIESIDARDWRRLVLALAAVAFLIRLVVIVATGGGFNLRIFYHFGRLIAEGTNPYNAPPGVGEYDPKYGDNAPPELLLFAGLLKIHDSPDTLRVFFALADVAVMTVVGLVYPRSRTFRFNFIVFYGFNPLLLEAWTGFADDKAMLLLCTVLVLVGLQRGKPALSWVSAGVLGVLKWYSVVFAPVLTLQSKRIRSWSWALIALLLFCLALAAAQLPYFPDSLDAFDRRNTRLDIDPPIHAAITQLVDEVGLYTPLIARLFAPLALLSTYTLFWLRKITAADAVVLSAFSAYVALPDEGFNRMLLITLPFLFVIGMSARRWIGLWAVSLMAAAAVLVEFRDLQVGWIESLFGAYGSVRHVLFVNAVMALVLAYYLIDRLGKHRSGAGAVEAAA